MQVLGNSNSSADDESSKVQKGTFYVVAKELMKSNNITELAVTGHSVHVRQPNGSSSTHGYDLKLESQWYFVLKDRESQSHTPGNACRAMVNPKVGLHGAFCWVWRFAFDKVHGKLTARKLFLGTAEDVQLRGGKPIKITRDID